MPKRDKQKQLKFLALLDEFDAPDIYDDLDDEAAEYLFDRSAEDAARQQQELRQAQEAEDEQAARQLAGKEWLGEVAEQRRQDVELLKALGEELARLRDLPLAGATEGELAEAKGRLGEATEALQAARRAPTESRVPAARQAVQRAGTQIDDVQQAVGERRARVQEQKKLLADLAKPLPAGADREQVARFDELVREAGIAVSAGEKEATPENVGAAAAAVGAVREYVTGVNASIAERKKLLEELRPALEGHKGLDHTATVKQEEEAIVALAAKAAKLLDEGGAVPTTAAVEEATAAVKDLNEKINRVKQNVEARKLLAAEWGSLFSGVKRNLWSVGERDETERLRLAAQEEIPRVDGDTTVAKAAIEALRVAIQAAQKNAALRAEELTRLNDGLDQLPNTIEVALLDEADLAGLRNLDAAARGSIQAVRKTCTEEAMAKAKQEAKAVEDEVVRLHAKLEALRNKRYRGTIQRPVPTGPLRINADKQTTTYGKYITIAANDLDAGLNDVVEFTLVRPGDFPSGAVITDITEKAETDYTGVLPFDTAVWTWATTAFKHKDEEGYPAELRNQAGVKEFLKANRARIRKSVTQNIYRVPSGSTTPNVASANRHVMFSYHPEQNKINVFHIE